MASPPPSPRLAPTATEPRSAAADEPPAPPLPSCPRDLPIRQLQASAPKPKPVETEIPGHGLTQSPSPSRRPRLRSIVVAPDAPARARHLPRSLLRRPVLSPQSVFISTLLLQQQPAATIHPVNSGASNICRPNPASDPH
ncbi:hypothetical protein PVAP13_3NG131802 [Panicum virgatum]|uniref:Uncharacterized protein n=1 Tax=Panicum virgatum TaxID=38727 RepID=A0A8T0UCR3_PANVG|nr:hypothetical protein PVAP13_3NG131802 [Panicum virgatum]